MYLYIYNKLFYLNIYLEKAFHYADRLIKHWCSRAALSYHGYEASWSRYLQSLCKFHGSYDVYIANKARKVILVGLRFNSCFCARKIYSISSAVGVVVELEKVEKMGKVGYWIKWKFFLLNLCLLYIELRFSCWLFLIDRGYIAPLNIIDHNNKLKTIPNTTQHTRFVEKTAWSSYFIDVYFPTCRAKYFRKFYKYFKNCKIAEATILSFRLWNFIGSAFSKYHFEFYHFIIRVKVESFFDICRLNLFITMVSEQLIEININYV